jgi:hypothetical protein
MVVDCGGGTVDITVHEISTDNRHLKEVFKATGGPFGSISKNILDLHSKHQHVLLLKNKSLFVIYYL